MDGLATQAGMLGAAANKLVTFFDGVNDYVELPVQPHGAKDFSFSIQFYIPTGYNSITFSRVFNLGQSSVSRVIAFIQSGRLFSRVGLSRNIETYNLADLGLDQWHELIITYNGTQFTSQVDGGSISTLSASFFNITTTEPFYISTKDGATFFLEQYTRRVAIGTIASPEIALFDDTTWVNKGAGSDGIISGATAVRDPAA